MRHLQPDVTAALDELIDRSVDQHRIPGVVAALTDGDEDRYRHAAGHRSIDDGAAMAHDTVMTIMSMTKPIAGFAAMQCVERGLLELDTPASEILPELGELSVYEGLGDDGPILRPPATQVTLRHLLTHTSGFVYSIWNDAALEYERAVDGPTSGSPTWAGARQPLYFDPGTRWEYGIGIDWAGLMVEAVVGESLGSYLERELFEPLGMYDTSFDLTDARSARAASLHIRTGEPTADGDGYHVSAPTPRERDFDGGGGGLYSTMPDYMRFMRLVLNDGRVGGEQLVSSATVDLMATNAMGPLRVGQLRSTNLGMSRHAEFMPNIEKSWGLTFQINEQPAPTGRPAGALSWAGMYNTYFWIDRANDLAGVWMTQLLPFADETAMAAFEDFETAVYRHLG